MLSVDVVAVRPDVDEAGAKSFRVGLGARVFEPHLGELALPGVLMRAGETVHDAARRALGTKIGVISCGVPLLRTGQVFDTPTRDQRGPTVSIGCLAILGPYSVGSAEWVSFDEVPPLPFDHNQIITVTRRSLADLIWHDPAVLAALLGRAFTTPEMVTLDSQVTGRPADPSNVRRSLEKLPHIERAGQQAAHGPGRPQSRWRIRTAH